MSFFVYDLLMGSPSNQPTNMKLNFHRVERLDHFDAMVGTPPYYCLHTFIQNGIGFVVYISSSDVLWRTARCNLGLPFEGHTLFAFYKDIVKLDAVRTVLQGAALYYPERFNQNTGNTTQNVNNSMRTLQTVLRLAALV